MIQTFKNLVKYILWEAGLYATTLTDIKEVQTLIGKLRPISPGMELVRLGPKGDGGYLVPDDLAGIDACFSPGVSDISGFEMDCANLGMQVFLADKSVENPAESHEKFDFKKKYVGAITSDDFMTMDDWIDSSLPESQSEFLLQMDTEGYEYETFLSMSSRLMQRCRIIVVEFHDLHMLWSRPFFVTTASRVFEKILQTHTCVHIHPNNASSSLIKNGIEIPYIMEFTFLRSDRVSDRSYANAFPHPLDYDNTKNPSLPLHRCWFDK